MTNKDQINKELCQEFNIPWHEDGYYTDGWHCSCGYKGFKSEVDDHLRRNPNPDFFTDPVRLLRLMEKLPDFEEFSEEFSFVIGIYSMSRDKWYIERDYILEEGKLARACLEWLRREK